ncbi:exocyst complex component EXO70E2 [Cocos nucifera]|uniref:Exocyst subunit Exo70 family protein n=1 Tax=Cocos nucifera TaxID=13894 RepID=A0A8K0N182_COCNU|nr:exocyst complex component EXO70E2 [Cocos nucifera]
MAGYIPKIAVAGDEPAITTEERGKSNIEERLGFLEDKILSWDSDQSMIWDRNPEEASKYLKAVDEVRLLTENLGSLHLDIEDREHDVLMSRGYDILQMAMARLEEEFIHLLIQYQQPVEPEHMSFHSTEEDSVDDYSFSSFDEEQVEGRIRGDSSRGSEEFVIDLVHSCAIFDLKRIAEMMFLAKYDKECCQAYISLRKDALDECLSVLRVEKLSIEDVLKMDWTTLNCKIKRWNCMIKVFIRVYLVSERHLCDLIFRDLSQSVRDSCFVETSKSSILQLFNFGEAVAIGSMKPDKLFRILDMYEGLTDLIMDIEALFPEECGACILLECHEVLLRLSEHLKGTLNELKNCIRTSTSNIPLVGGGIHPLTKYVMNYLRVLVDSNEILNMLLEDQDKNQSAPSEDGGRSSYLNSSPMGDYLKDVTSILESNLETKSMLYKEDSLKYFFKMNNVRYMVRKVNDSELQLFLGDDWIREHSRKFRHHAMCYERASWNHVLSFLKDEGIWSPGSSTPSKTILKERFQNFNLAFEEVYRVQTAWIIPDVQLREDLRISISLKVLQAYRTFMGRYSNYLDGARHRDRYIKYHPDDLESCLLDLFEGSTKVLHHPRRK